MTQSVQSIRERVRMWRSDLDASTRSRAAGDLADRGAGWEALTSARHLGAYVAVDGEVDPAPLVERLGAIGAQPHLPVLDGDRLRFALDDAPETRRANRFGILEPTGPTVDATRLDVVLVPLVAVDHRGNRLGFGAGYYDRTFSALAGGTRPARPLLIGLAYDEQVVDTLPAQPWDVPLDALLTPTRRLGFSVPVG